MTGMTYANHIGKTKKSFNAVHLKVLKDSALDSEVDYVLGAGANPGPKQNEPRSHYLIETVFEDTDFFKWDNHETTPAESLPVFPPARGHLEGAQSNINRPSTMEKKIYHPRDPMVWHSLSDLFVLCGPILTVFIALQVVSCMAITHVILHFRDLNHLLLDGILISGVLAIDGLILACLRGRHYRELSLPFILQSLFTVLPGILAFVWLKISDMF